MSKFADFGGLPENIFKDYLTTYSNTALVPVLSEAQRREVLTALADEEHAAAVSSSEVKVGDLVEQCLALQSAHTQVVNASAATVAGAVGKFVNELNNLKKLWT